MQDTELNKGQAEAFFPVHVTVQPNKSGLPDTWSMYVVYYTIGMKTSNPTQKNNCLANGLLLCGLQIVISVTLVNLAHPVTPYISRVNSADYCFLILNKLLYCATLKSENV